MSKSIKKIIILTVAILAFATPILALASSGVAAGTPNIGIFSGIFGNYNLSQIIIRIVQILLALIGFIAVVILIYSGFIWMTAAGDPNKVEKAKRMIYGAIIGLIIIFSAFAIVSFIWNAFGPPPPVEPCTNPGEIQGCTTFNNCSGSRQCLATPSGNYWGPCISVDPYCDPNNPFYGGKFANIFKFSDPNLPNWSGRQWGYKNHNSGVIALPKTDTLRLDSFAHNYTTFGAIVGLRLWEAKTTSTEQDFGPLTIASSGQYLLNNKPYYFAWASTTLTASTSIPYSTTTLRVSVNDNTENDYYSKSVRVRFWPKTCFNGVIDPGEKDIDCGGPCPNCDGDTCRRPELNVCDDSNCASEICNADCHCAIRPEIAYVDPALDVNSDTDRSNIKKDDVDDDISNGATSTYITIFGRHFGKATGTVYFVPKNLLGQTQAPLALCAKSWSSNQIIATVPDSLNYYNITKEIDITSTTLANPLQNYEIFVQPGTTTLTSNNWDFQVNKIDRPGICQMDPGSGTYPATTTATGHNFPALAPHDVFWGANSSTLTFNWSNYQVSDVVPENKKGRNSVRVYNGEFYSNYYIFLVSAGGLGDPCGYDTFSCHEDIDTCQTGLNCQYCQNSDANKPNYKADCDTNKNCTCQHSEVDKCDYVSETDRDSRSCTIGGCPGNEFCSNNKTWSGVCVDIVDSCVPFLGNSSNHSAFSWAFFAKKNPFPGMSCVSELWNDGTCDINGCIDKNLACDTAGSYDEWIELYNPTNNVLSLSDHNLAYHEDIDGTVKDGLVLHYSFDELSGGNKIYNIAQAGAFKNNINYGTSVVTPVPNCIAGNCISLNQSNNSQLVISSTPEIDRITAKSFSFATWFYPTASPSGRDPMIIARGSGFTLGLHYQWDNRFVFTVFTQGSAKFTAGSKIYSYLDLANRRWYHLTGTYDDDSKLLRIYVDGTLEGEVTVTSTGQLYRHLGSPILIGNRQTFNSIYPVSGKIDDVKIYNRALSAGEVSKIYQERSPSIYNKGFFSLNSLTIDPKSYLLINSSTLAATNFRLPSINGGLVAILDNSENSIDNIRYGGNYIYPGYSPASIGRKGDGLDNNTTTDFVYYPNSTPNTNNNPKIVTSTDHLVINELSLAHDACTCVPKDQMCIPGRVDSTSCPPLDQCKQIRKCQTNGHYGSCELANPNCIAYPSVPSSTIAAFSWNFNTNRKPPYPGPIIVSDCMGNGTCDDNNVLPSPTPWGERWNKVDRPDLDISNSVACLNAVISARFSDPMDAQTINLDNIRIYKFDYPNQTWHDSTTDLMVPAGVKKLATGETGINYFKLELNPGVRLAEESQYLVFISKAVKDEIGRPLVDDPNINGVRSDRCPTGVTTTPGVCWEFNTRFSGYRDRSDNHWPIVTTTGRFSSTFIPTAGYFYPEGKDGTEVVILGYNSVTPGVMSAYRGLRVGGWNDYTTSLRSQGLPNNFIATGAYFNKLITNGGSVDVFGYLSPNQFIPKIYTYNRVDNNWVDRTATVFTGATNYLPNNIKVDTAFYVPTKNVDKIYVFGHDSGNHYKVFTYYSNTRSWIDETAQLLSGGSNKLPSNFIAANGFYYTFNGEENIQLWGKIGTSRKVYKYDIARNIWLDDTANIGLPANYNNLLAYYSNFGTGGGRIFYMGTRGGNKVTWINSFQDLLCPVGCINCNPKRYFNRYYGEEKLHSASPISADNVCIILDSRDYPWDWYEEEQSNQGQKWDIQKLFDLAYSWMTDPFAIDGIGRGHQNANTPNAGYGTSTAYRESGYEQYDESTWFSKDDYGYFRITAQEMNSQHFGSSPAHNNFTDPIVRENQYCTKSADPAKRVLQSPSPWKGQRDACINAVVFALFSRNMKNDTLVTGNKVNQDNIEVYDCGNNESSATSTQYGVSGCSEVSNNWDARIFNYVNESLTLRQLMDAPTSVNDYLKSEGIRIFPNGNFKQNNWYKVVIKGGEDGVRGGSPTPSGEEAEGILRVPNPNALMFTGTNNDKSYYWYFKTGVEECPIDEINVLPQLAFMPEVGPTQEYEADPVAANCNHLNPFNYRWYWKSLINPFTDKCTEPASGDGIANICAVTSISCLNSSNNPQPPFVKAFSKSEGNTKISARAASSTATNTCDSDKMGYGELQIGYGGFSVLDYNNSDCLNTDIFFNFSNEASSTSISPNSNVLLYRCGGGDDSCPINTATQEDIKLLYPTGWPSNVSPLLSSRGYVMPTTDLSTSTVYRMVLRGGKDGIKSFVGAELSKLNFNIFPNSGGESCDPSVSPWKPGGGDADKCGANCLLKNNINLCGSDSEQCNNNGLLAYYNLNDTIFNRTGIADNIFNNNIGEYVPGVSGKAVELKNNPANHSYIRLASTTAASGVNIVSSTRGTVSVWARPMDTGVGNGNYGHIFYAGPTASTANGLGGDPEFHISTYNGSNTSNRGFIVNFGVKNPTNGSATALIVNYQTNYKLGEWKHLTASYDFNASAGNKISLKFYIDGKLVVSTSTNLNTSPTPYKTVYLGRPVANERFFIGDIDEVSVYDRVLTDAEVSGLYSSKGPTKVIYGCNASCKLQGNIFIASCGNGKVEPGEDCDDSNVISGDGCSVKCLAEGSSSSYKSVCGNGKIEWGEQCDDGDKDSGDGCSNNCLYENNYATTGTYSGFSCNSATHTANATTTITVAGKQVIVYSVCQTPGLNGCNTNCKHSGAYPNVSVCGNGKVEDGEECDDSNVNNGDKCSSRCLWEGTTVGTGQNECGNGNLDDGKFDSFSWTFKLSAGADVCKDIGWGLNPCPNGIWSFTANHSIDDLKVTAYQGRDTNTGNCISDADMRKLGFWRRVINFIVKAIKSFFGLESATAADFWCPITNSNELNFSNTELAAMAKGNFKRNTNFDGANVELLGYTQDNGDFKVDIIRDKDWATSTEYKFIAVYQKNGVNGTSTATIKTFDTADKCKLAKIRFDVWPRGLSKTSDAFFCASDPTTGKPDDCGRYSSDLYDDDMSASWTKDYPGNGYDLDKNANIPNFTTNNYMPGNQHIYRVWALTSSTNDAYVVRANFSKLQMINISAETTSTQVRGTSYGGDVWTTSGFKPGRSLFSVTAVDPEGRTILGSADGALPIYTTFCNNPWPDAKNFPFIDNGNNCTAGSGSCINTNFGTYYCRDTGVTKTCVNSDDNKLIGMECNTNSDCWRNKALISEASCQLYTNDDLPSIGDFNALTGEIDRGVAKGNLGENCQNLPNNFKLGLGYYSYVEGAKILWDINKTSIYKNNGGTGWEKIDKGFWQLKGLPANFNPVFAYSLKVGVSPNFVTRDYLWGNSDIYYYNGSEWVRDLELKSKLPVGFWPSGGYFYSSAKQVGLFNSAGKVTIVTYNDSGAIDPAISPNPSALVDFSVGGNLVRPRKMVDYSYGGRGPILLDMNGNVFQFVSGYWTLQTVTPKIPSNFAPVWVLSDTATSSIFFGIDPQNYTLSYNGGNNWSFTVSPGTYYKTCDNKLKEFLFAGIKPGEGEEIYIVGTSTISSGAAGKPFEPMYDGSLATRWGTNTGQNSILYDVNIPESGKYYITIETSNLDGLTTILPIGFNGDYVGAGSGCFQGVSLSGRDVYHKIEVSVDGLSTSTITALASHPNERQLNRAYLPFSINQKGYHRVSLRWINDCGCFGASCQYGDMDSNLRIYSVRLNNVNHLSINDAIGLRVYNNNNHYSAALWYKMKFNPYTQGTLSDMIVDGNRAVSEGRTVYVNAPDFGQIGVSGNRILMNANTTVYSDIYLMSYNEGAAKSTQNIFSQMVNNWFFNAGSRDVAGLDTDQDGDVGTCSGGKGDSNYCLTDIDCMKRGTGYCNSNKARISRDNIRLGDVQDIYAGMDDYYNTSRCSNDFTKTCKNNAECFGGGVCGNFYPNLSAGTYITGKSYSIWPSWQETLGKELGFKLPIDPLNLIFASSSGLAEKCSDPYNPITCWSEKDKNMNCNIHTSSSFYAYYTNKSGTSTNIYIKGEVFPYGGKWQPANWGFVNNLRYNPFAGFFSQINSNQFCSRIIESCGDGSCVAGENCSTCPIDCGCGIGTACQKPAGTWTCEPIRNCGDFYRQVDEECDLGSIINGGRNGVYMSGCTDNCYCATGFDCRSGTPTPLCGDGIIAGDEECEFTIDGPTCGDETLSGELCCDPTSCTRTNWWSIYINDCITTPSGCVDGCGPTGRKITECGDPAPCKQKCERVNNYILDCTISASVCQDNRQCNEDEGFYEDGVCRYLSSDHPCAKNCISTNTGLGCGDGIVEDGEVCDCGDDSNPLYNQGGVRNNPFSPCYNTNTDTPYAYRAGGGSYEYCKANCDRDTNDFAYCGDGRVDVGNEICDPGGLGVGFIDDDCQNNCNPVSGAYCNGVCCWSPNDGDCEPTCGETHTANTCDDCAVCHNSSPWSDDACCDTNCNWMPNGTFDGIFYCGTGGNPTDCSTVGNKPVWITTIDNICPTNSCVSISDTQECRGNSICGSYPGRDCNLGSTQSINSQNCNPSNVCCRSFGDNWLNEAICGILPGERFSIRFSGSANCGGTITNPYLSVNSSCGSGADGLNANVSVNDGDRDRFDFTMINDNDGNGVLSRGDNIKLHNIGVNRNIKLSGVGAIGTDWFNGNASSDEEIVFNVCDSGGCGNTGVLMVNGSTICLRFINSRGDKGRVETDPSNHRPLKAVYGNSEYNNPCADTFIITSP